MTADASEQLIQAITQKMRDTYLELGQVLIPLLENTAEDIRTLLELGEVYESLGCIPEAVAAYDRARQWNPNCLPAHAHQFLVQHADDQLGIHGLFHQGQRLGT